MGSGCPRQIQIFHTARMRSLDQELLCKGGSNSLLVLQDGEFIVIEDAKNCCTDNNTESNTLLSSVRQFFNWIQTSPALAAISDARKIVQTVSTISDIPKSDGVYFFNLNLKLSVRDIHSESNSVKLELRPVDLVYMTGVNPDEEGESQDYFFTTVHVTAVQVAVCYQNFVKLLRMTEFSSICSTKKVASPSIAQNNKSGGDVDAAAVCSLEDNTHNMEDRLGHHLLAGLEWTSWDDFKGLFSADLKTLQSHFGKKKLVKCSLKHVQFESSIGNHHHSYMGQVREHSFLSHNFDIWRLPMTSDEDEVAESRPTLIVTYRDALFTLGKPNNPDLASLFTQLTNQVRVGGSPTQRLQEVLAQLLNSSTQVDPACPESNRSALPLSMQLSLSGPDSHAHTYMQSYSGWGHRYSSVMTNRDAYVRLLQSLEASSLPSSREDFLFVLRICPKIDEDNQMLINDVLVSIEAMLII
eukprot:gene32194-41735_t